MDMTKQGGYLIMKSSQTPGGPEEQPGVFADLPAYPEHAESTTPAAPGHGDVPYSKYAPAARYEFTQNRLLGKGNRAIVDDSGNLRFTVPRNGGLCDPSGYELAAFDRHPFRNQVDIIRHGAVAASVRARLGIGKHCNIDSPTGKFAASGHFLGDRYTLTGPGGDEVASVTQQQGFCVEIAPGQDNILVLAIILAIENVHDHKRASIAAPH